MVNNRDDDKPGTDGKAVPGFVFISESEISLHF